MKSLEISSVGGILCAVLIWSSRPACATDSPGSAACGQDGQQACSDVKKPDWELDKEQVNKAWEACKADVEKFCEGVQAGNGRVENCLDVHAVELSTSCQAARGSP